MNVNGVPRVKRYHVRHVGLHGSSFHNRTNFKYRRSKKCICKTVYGASNFHNLVHQTETISLPPFHPSSTITSTRQKSIFCSNVQLGGSFPETKSLPSPLKEFCINNSNLARQIVESLRGSRNHLQFDVDEDIPSGNIPQRNDSNNIFG